MSEKSQKALMKEVSKLISQDLSYCFGDRESGPNGAKKVFLTKSAAFLRALAKDIGFSDYTVKTNPGGIAVSGEATLRGMWSEWNGIMFELTQPSCGNAFLYCEISGMKEYKGGQNKWMDALHFANQDYQKVCKMLLELKKEGEKRIAA